MAACETCERPLRKKQIANDATQCRACLIDMSTWTDEHLEKYIAKYTKKVMVADRVMSECDFRTNHHPLGCQCNYFALEDLKEKIRKAEAMLASNHS